METEADSFAEAYDYQNVPGELAGVPIWAVWIFVVCFFLIIGVLLLDYCVIRRNALGNTCCARARQKRHSTNASHQKRSTNMLLNMSVVRLTSPMCLQKLNRQGQGWDAEV